LQQIFSIIKKEFLLEWRQRNSIYGLILYLLSLVFLIYMMQEEPEGLVWNTLIWICALFVVINAVAKSFMGEAAGKWQYYYTIYHPKDLITAKLIYNALFMLVISFLTLLLFSFFIGFPPNNALTYIAIFCLGVVSLGLLFTFLSSIVAKSGSNSTMLAIIGLPLVVPILILLSDLSVTFFQPMLVKNWSSFLYALFAMDIIIIILSRLLYPYLWKE
jgi:heme exporter protein B